MLKKPERRAAARRLHRTIQATSRDFIFQLQKKCTIETDTRQNLEIRGMEGKVSSLEKRMRLIEESSDQRPKNLISENQTIKTSAPAFTKTSLTKKRTGSDMPPPTNAKRLQLDAASSASSECCVCCANTTIRPRAQISSALETLQKSCSDVLPTNRIDTLCKGACELPVLTDEENSVISEFCVNKSSAEMFLSLILDLIKAEKESTVHDLLQSYCRVYVGLCQQRADSHKAHALAYRLLKEDFPEAPKLIMVMVTAWPCIFSHDSALCRAIHIVSKMKADGNILDLLSKYMYWDEDPPGNIYNMIVCTLKDLFEDHSLRFQKSSWYGYDLCDAAWNYIFSVDLLCAQLGWPWTLNNIIRMDLWLILNTWLRKTRSGQTPFRGICLGAVFRLLGRLGKQGLKENMLVENLAKNMIEFGNQNLSKGMSWEVQLSVIYAIHDLSASNPEKALKALISWQQKIRQPVPPAVTMCLKKIGLLCHQIRPKI
ncbi:little elongation complex subunit 1 [Silurus meridionalis]|nr:little elongation complex subunit 1 [Silurus meridionalis]